MNNTLFNSDDSALNSLPQDNDVFSNLLHPTLEQNYHDSLYSPIDTTHQALDYSTEHSHQSVLCCSYSSLNGSDDHKPQISVTDDVIYRHNLDGSTTKVGYVTHDSDGHYIYDCDSNGYKNHLVCNIDLNGNVHEGTYTSAGYMGYVNNGKICSRDDNVIGYCDSNVEGAAHLFFVGN